MSSIINVDELTREEIVALATDYARKLPSNYILALGSETKALKEHIKPLVIKYNKKEVKIPELTVNGTLYTINDKCQLAFVSANRKGEFTAYLGGSANKEVLYGTLTLLLKEEGNSKEIEVFKNQVVEYIENSVGFYMPEGMRRY